MATRTISAAGGVFTATGTWVGGVAPIADDNIVGLSTSGPLTVSAATVALAGMDFSQYTNTLTLNNTLLFGMATANTTTTFSPTMSIVTGTTFNETNSLSYSPNGAGTGICSLRTNGKVLPYLKFSKQNGAGRITLLDDLNCTTLSVGKGNSNTMAINGTYSININHFYVSDLGGGNFGGFNSTPTINFVGPTASYFVPSVGAASTDPVRFFNCNLVIDVGATGTFSTFGPLAIAGTNTANFKVTWKSGILGGDKSIMLWSYVYGTLPITLELEKAGTWSNVYYNDFSPTQVARTLKLESDLLFNNMTSNYFSTSTPLPTSRQQLLVTGGTGSLKGGTITAITSQTQPSISGTPNSVIGSPSYSTPWIRLNPGPVHTFSEIKVMGWKPGLEIRNSNSQANLNAYIQSSTASTRATINFTGTQSTFWVAFNDIDASGGNMIYNYEGTQSNSLNIGTVSFGSAAATTGWTFVN